jgi:hypothetical protein
MNVYEQDFLKATDRSQIKKEREVDTGLGAF